MNGGKQAVPGELIRHYREKRSMSKTQLARAVGVDRSYISLLESGKRTVPLELATTFADVLHFTYEDRENFYRALQVSNIVERYYHDEVEERWYDSFRAAFRGIPFLKQVVNKPWYLSEWALGRFYVARFDMRRAVPN